MTKEQRRARNVTWAKKGSEIQRRRDERFREFVEWRERMKTRDGKRRASSKAKSIEELDPLVGGIGEETLVESAADPEVIMEQWELTNKIYGYNASEAAEEWFARWGVLQERATSHHRERVNEKDLSKVFAKVARVSVSEGSVAM